MCSEWRTCLEMKRIAIQWVLFAAVDDCGNVFEPDCVGEFHDATSLAVQPERCRAIPSQVYA